MAIGFLEATSKKDLLPSDAGVMSFAIPVVQEQSFHASGDREGYI